MIFAQSEKVLNQKNELNFYHHVRIWLDWLENKKGVSQKSDKIVAAPFMGTFSDQKRRHEACVYTF